MTTIAVVSAALRDGTTTAAAEAERCLSAIAAPAGEGAAAFIHVDPGKVRQQAAQSDTRRAADRAAGPLEGVPISLKDLFDVEGEVTRGGSVAYAPAPASADATAVARLRAAGAIFVGRTNMTEFAYSGVGINPHYGTPAAPWDRSTRRIPGGSTSGGAVSVSDGMAVAAIGTNTGGSCRIPAACCGLTGFKPTARRIPLDGCLPLSFTLDSIGAIGRSVGCVALLDAIMSGRPAELPPAAPVGGVRLVAPTNYVLDGMDDVVGAAWAAALERLRAAGIVVEERAVPFLDYLPEVAPRVTITAIEAYAWHRPLLDRAGERYDPRVRSRILAAETAGLAEYQGALSRRRTLMTRADLDLAGYDGMLMPTLPIVPPPMAAFTDDRDFARLNLLMLRNPTIANLLDGCAINLPVPAPGGAPVGLGLLGRTGEDRQLLGLARALETILEAEV